MSSTTTLDTQFSWVARQCPGCTSKAVRRVVVECNIDSAKLNSASFSSRKAPEYMHPRMVECADCGLIYATPVLDQEVIARAYATAVFESQEESLRAARTYTRIVFRSLPFFDSSWRVLDIGAGDGSFLRELFHMGWNNLLGVEPSEAPIALADPKVRPLIRCELFRAENFRNEQFELITCFQIMEHVINPAELMRDAFSLLTDGGAVVAVVHDVNAVSARVLGSKSPIFDIEHLQLFSSKTIASLLRDAGFTNVDVRPIWNRYPLQYWLRLLPLPVPIKRAALKVAKDRIGRISCPLRAGNLLAIGRKAC